MKNMTKVVILLGALLVLPTASYGDDAKTKAADRQEAAKEKNAARKKARLDFMNGERDKRWEMEDELTKEEREFLDESRKAHRDAERKLSDELAAAGDAKAENEAHKHFTDTQAQLKAKRDEYQKKMEAKRKAFHDQAEKDRKAFDESQKDKK